ncbi:hypothetical protein ACU4HD_45760 (plasmid) [Cupriavidus basilensis]
MKDIKHHEDRVCTTDEVCGILARGIGPGELETWPLVYLPEYVIAVARASAADPDHSELGELEEAQRARRGLRTDWGILVVDLRQRTTAGKPGHVLSVEGFLADDTYLELPHLRRRVGETVGLYLSDLMHSAIERGHAGELLEGLSKMGLEWEDNDQTGQVFAFIGFSEPAQQLDFAELGALLARWLGKSGLDRVADDVRKPEALRTVTERSMLPITRDSL